MLPNVPILGEKYVGIGKKGIRAEAWEDQSHQEDKSITEF